MKWNFDLDGMSLELCIWWQANMPVRLTLLRLQVRLSDIEVSSLLGAIGAQLHTHRVQCRPSFNPQD